MTSGEVTISFLSKVFLSETRCWQHK